MLGERVSIGIHLQRLGARLTLAAVLSTGFAVIVTTPRALAAQEPASPNQTGDPSSGRSDADIENDVTYALAHSKALQGQHITAATIEGDVTVSGNVRDEASKELAETIIDKVKGVRSVTNNLNVGDAPQTNTANAQPQDSNTTTPEQDLNYDPAQQNMAQAGPQDQNQQQAQGAPAPDQPNMPPAPPSNDPQYSAQRQPYPQQPYGQQPAYGQQQPYGQQTYPQQPLTPVTIPVGTLLQVRTSEPLDATRVQPGQVFAATVAADIYMGGVLALPRGAVVTGKVVATQSNKGDLAGKQGLSLVVNSVNLGGQLYPLPTDTWSGQGPGKGGYSAGNTIGAAGLGAVIGAIAGGGAGAAIGAGAGAIVGAGTSAATTGPRMYVPAEAVLNFHLLAPVTVTPVTAQEAQRLASSSQPQLQRRGPYPYPYGAYPPPPPPGYYYYPYRYPVVYPSYYYGYRY
jgi:hypothetical protein